MSSITNAFRNVFRGVASLLETGSWQVEEAANQARSAGVLLDRVDEEVEMRAQETLDSVNAALTEYGKLQNRQTMLTKQVADWDSKARGAAAKAKECPIGGCAVGPTGRGKWEKLTKEALVQKAKFAAELKVVEEALAASEPDANKALELVQEIGFTKQQALSQRDSLQVANATARAKLQLANARKTWGTGSGPGQLLKEAQQKVSEATAQALASEQIEAAMPASAEQVAAEIGREQAQSAVEKELAALLAEEPAGQVG